MRLQNMSGPGAALTAPDLADWIGADMQDRTESADGSGTEWFGNLDRIRTATHDVKPSDFVGRGKWRARCACGWRSTPTTVDGTSVAYMQHRRHVDRVKSGCVHGSELVSEPITAERPMPAHRCSDCGVVVIGG